MDWLKTQALNLLNSNYNNYDMILNNLYLGNSVSAGKDTIDSLGISLVINATQDIPFYSNNTYNVRVPVNDDLAPTSIVLMANYMRKVLPIMKRYLNDNKKVLVHCRAGMQRSAAIVAAYLMTYYNMSVYDAIDFVKSKRSIAFFPGPNFLHTLEIVDKRKLN
jgi:protein-tyrosine phosphatase